MQQTPSLSLDDETRFGITDNKLEAIISHALLTLGGDPSNAFQRDETLAVFRDDAEAFAESMASFVAESVRQQATLSDVKPAAPPHVAELPLPAKIAAKNDREVEGIADLITSKIDDEATRNLKIGRKVYEHAIWQAANFPGWIGKDFDRLCVNIHTRVCVLVQIDSRSIRIPEWTRAYVLRKLVAEAKGEDVTARLSCYDYMRLSPHALTFDKKAMQAELVDGWVDFVADISMRRSNGERITAEMFKDEMTAFAIRAKSVAAKPMNADERATAEAETARKKAETARSKALKAIDADVQHAVTCGVPLVDLIKQIESSAKLQGKALIAATPETPAISVSPGPITIADLNRIIDQLFASHQYAEMLHAKNRLASMIDQVDKAVRAMQPTPAMESVAAAVELAAP